MKKPAPSIPPNTNYRTGRLPPDTVPTFLGRPMFQRLSALPCFDLFFAELTRAGTPPGSIVELGTFQGALTAYLTAASSSGPWAWPPHIHTFDIVDWLHGGVPTSDFLSRVCEPARLTCYFGWDFHDSHKKRTLEIIKGLTAPRLVLCDGGDGDAKIEELRMVAPVLSDGDFLLAHDYSPDDPEAQVTPAHVAEICDEHAFAPWMQATWDKYDTHWCCMRKGDKE